MKISSNTPHDVNTLSTSGLDDFECALLPLARHFWDTLTQSQPLGWHRAGQTASEHWGETIGLSVAHHLFKVTQALDDCRSTPLQYKDPLCISSRQHINEDELQFLLMLHHMRRDQTVQARAAVMYLTDGNMDPYFIRSAIQFSTRFSCGHQTIRQSGAPQPVLRVVT